MYKKEDILEHAKQKDSEGQLQEFAQKDGTQVFFYWLKLSTSSAVLSPAVSVPAFAISKAVKTHQQMRSDKHDKVNRKQNEAK